MKCEQCGMEHDGMYGSGRFCSEHCKRVFCGKQSNKDGKLTGHPGYKGPRKYVALKNIDGPCICRFCGDERKNQNSLINHERLCKMNPARDVRSYEILMSNVKQHNTALHNGECAAWNKGLTALTDNRVMRYATTLRSKFANGEIIPSFEGKRHAMATKEKKRKSTNEYIEHTAGGPRYSIMACAYFDALNKRTGWNLIHAMNGGEMKVGRYSVDAYDAERNIVVEYDENKHHLYGFQRKSKDIKREQYIKEALGCTFYRYSEFNDKLYQV